jgi:hypothetical protein
MLVTGQIPKPLPFPVMGGPSDGPPPNVSRATRFGGSRAALLGAHVLCSDDSDTFGGGPPFLYRRGGAHGPRGSGQGVS